MKSNQIQIPSAQGEGFLQLLETFGDDSTITKSARVSYAKGTKGTRKDRDLLRYLMRHKHTTPFEMCSARFHIRCPVFVARQWFRHRTGSFNEISARYSEMEDRFYVPDLENIRKAPAPGANRQGSSDAFPEQEAQGIQIQMQEHSQRSYDLYKELLDQGVSREIARTVLPQSMMTEFLWMVNLHNLLHFLELRCGQDAQEEIRVYAIQIVKLLQDWVPETYQAFLDYRLDSNCLSPLEKEEISKPRCWQHLI